MLSGNRNFEARIHSDVKANYLASPPLVVAYALAGRMDIDLLNEPLGEGDDGPVFLHDIWPTSAEIDETIASSVDGAMFKRSYGDVLHGRRALARARHARRATSSRGSPSSTYVRLPPYFDGMPREPEPVAGHRTARACS